MTVCPILSVGKEMLIECLRNDCAWYIDDESVCALKQVAIYTQKISGNTVNISIKKGD